MDVCGLGGGGGVSACSRGWIGLVDAGLPILRVH